MTSYYALKLLHLLAMVYWLGGDLGTFYASRFVSDSKLSPPQRSVALRIMLGCDQGPKLCMPLMFALGYSMATRINLIALPAAVEVVVWVVALLWFANVNYLYFTKNADAKARLSRIDLWVRVVAVIALIGVSVHSLLGTGLLRADWLAAKVLVFAILIVCGIYIRIQLKPFVAAFGHLMSSGSSPAIEATLRGSIARCKPAVYLIWAGLIVNAAFGIHLL